MARDLTTAQQLVVGDVPAIDITNAIITISAWFWADTASGADRWIVSKWGSQYVLYISSGGNLSAGFGGAAFPTGPSVSTGAWHHALCFQNGTGSRVYLDGVAGGAAGAAAMGNHATSLAFGGNNFDGKIAEVAIWDVALVEASEIPALAKGISPLLVRPQSLKGYWPIIGNVSPEPDLRNGNNATLTGSPTAFPHPRILKPRPAIYVP